MSPMESSVNDMVKGKIHARTAHLAIKRGLLHIISTLISVTSDIFISSIADQESTPVADEVIMQYNNGV